MNNFNGIRHILKAVLNNNAANYLQKTKNVSTINFINRVSLITQNYILKI